jgi:Flp pilus assembly protein TadD
MKTLTQDPATLPEQRHSEGVRLYGQGQFADAAAILEAAFRENPSSELANDLGAAELACGRIALAEQLFVEALRMDVKNLEAAANLGVLLAGQGRAQEAVVFLESAALRTTGTRKAALEHLLANCRVRAAVDALDKSLAGCERFVAQMNSERATADGLDKSVVGCERFVAQMNSGRATADGLDKSVAG